MGYIAETVVQYEYSSSIETIGPFATRENAERALIAAIGLRRGEGQSACIISRGSIKAAPLPESQ